MTLKEIENRVAKQEENALITHNQTYIEERILETLNTVIKNNIKINLTENDLIEIANLYYHVFHKYNLNFLKQLVEYSDTEIDFYKLLNRL